MDGDESAFPAVGPGGVQRSDGLTKRELFAAMAMQGLLAGRMANCVEREDMSYEEHVALCAVLCADALIREFTEETL